MRLLSSRRVGCLRTNRHLAFLIAMAVVAGFACVADSAGAEVVIGVTPSDPGGLDAARDRAREAVKRHREPVRVELGAGTYVLEHGLVLTASDSGTAKAPVTWTSTPGGRVRISGGREVGGWGPVTDPAILARLDHAVRSRVLVTDLRAQGLANYGTFRRRGFGLPRAVSALELVCDDAIMPLARHPSKGWLTVTATLTGGDAVRFAFTDAEAARWGAAPDLWVHGYWTYDWADTHDPVLDFSPARGEAAIHAPAGWYGIKTGARFAFENALEALDAPGEWWLDRAAGKLYFLPPSDAKPVRTVVTMIEEPLVSLEGASYVRVEGMILEDARGDGVLVEGGANCRIAGCTIRNLGGLGAAIKGGRGHLVRSCDVYGAGEGAIAVEGGDRPTLKACGNAVENNDLHDFCRWARTYKPGVQVDGVGCRVAHNWIHDAPHNGILLGGNDHVIEFNLVERVCLETGDSGAFYMGRDPTMRGTVVRNNLFRDLKPTQSRPGEFNNVMAVYLDDCACGTRVEGNLFVRAAWGVMIGGGRDNEVRGNVFVDCDPGVSVDSRALNWAKDYYNPGGGWEMVRRLAAVPYRNALWRARYPKLAGYSLATCAAPAGNRIVGNVSTGGRWLELVEGLTPSSVEIRDNVVEGAPGVKPATWPPIPLDRIGLERDRFRPAPRPSR